MSTTIRNATWDTINALRSDIEPALRAAPTLAIAAQRFVEMFVRSFDTVALARLFLVTPFAKLPQAEQSIAITFASGLVDAKLDDATPVLSLLGTAGRSPKWNKRETSLGHRAVPLVDNALIQSAPMISALLNSLDVDLEKLRGDPAIQLRHLTGGLNARFYVHDARNTLDQRGRHVIAAQDFVHTHGIRTVFGMGGAYVGGSLAVAILFTQELLAEVYVDRLPSFISTFKLATSDTVAQGHLF